MKILLLNWRDIKHPKSGGAELVTMEHAKGWVKRGHSVTWVTSMYKGAKPHEFVDGVEMIRKAGSLSIYPVGFFYTLIHGNKYDVVVDEIHGLAFFTPLATNTPVVGFIHEVAGSIWDYMAPFPLNNFGKLIERLYLPLYRNVPIWTDAPSTVNELQTYGIKKSRCISIPCPIPGDVPKKISPKKEASLTCIFVSRIVPMKGIEDIIQAFALIHSKEPKAKLRIIGTGDDKYIVRLTTLIEDLSLSDAVTWYGKVTEKEKYQLLASSHVLLHASVKEGWGLVVLEAAAVGTPAVVYNVAGLKDVVKQNQTGIILEKNTPEDMALQVTDLYKNTKQYSTFRKDAKEWATSIRWSDVIDLSINVLKQAQTIKRAI